MKNKGSMLLIFFLAVIACQKDDITNQDVKIWVDPLPKRGGTHSHLTFLDEHPPPIWEKIFWVCPSSSRPNTFTKKKFFTSGKVLP